MKLPLSIELLHQFSPEEQGQFLRYLNSPYHNADTRLHDLANWIMNQEAASITREAAFSFLFPGEPFHYDSITNFFSYLQRHIEQFLGLEQWKEDPANVKLFALRAAEHRGWNRLFAKLSGKWARLARQILPMAETDLLQQQEVALLQNQHLIRQGIRTTDNFLETRGKLLRDYSLLSRLSNACQWLTMGQVMEGNESALMAEEIAVLLKVPVSRLSHPLAEIYQVILRMMTEEESEPWYQAFRIKLDELEGFASDRKTLFQYAQNYCIRQANSGETTYLNELFRLYQQMLREELIFDQGMLSLSDIKNIVALGVRLEEFGWTREFLERYADRFPLDQRENILTYNLAYLAEAEGKPEKAMKLLRGVEFEDIFYQLGGRIILVKCYYQLRDLDGLEAAIHAFSTWLRRDKRVSAYQRKVHLNLLRFIRKLAILRATLDIYSPAEAEKRIQRLGNQIRATKEITNINWVEKELEKVMQ